MIATEGSADIVTEPARGTIARAASVLDRWLASVEKVLVLVLTVALTLAVLTQVVSRHLLAEPNPWTEELARYLFVWVSMLGASVATQMRAHFGLEVLLYRFPHSVRQLAAILSWVVMLVTAAAFTIYGWRFVSNNALMTGPATEIPMAWINSAVPIGMTAICVHLLLAALYRPFQPSGHH